MLAIYEDGKCLFCDAKKLTAEHLWGNWTIKEAKSHGVKSGNKTKIFHGVRHGTKNKGTVQLEVPGKKGQFFRNGMPLHMKWRIVCANCNNGWMSRLETAAKPLVLSVGSKPFQEMTAEQFRLMAKWCILKATLFTHCELIHHKGIVNDSKKMERSWISNNIPIYLMRDNIPNKFTVAICSLSSFKWAKNNLYYRALGGHSAETQIDMFGAIAKLGFWVTTTKHGRAVLMDLQHRSRGSIRVISPQNYFHNTSENRPVNIMYAESLLKEIIDYDVSFISQQEQFTGLH